MCTALTSALHGIIHSDNLHACHDYGQHPGITSSMAKKPAKYFFVVIVFVTVSIKTTTGRGHGSRWGEIRYDYCVLPIYSYPFSF